MRLRSTVAVALAACSPVADMSASNTAIAAFHQRLNAGDFAGIYADAGPQMRSATTQDDMVKLLSAVHRKLGPFVSGADQGWNDNVATGGHFVTVTYAAKYQRGAATETFVFGIQDKAARLVGYNVNSNAMLEN